MGVPGPGGVAGATVAVRVTGEPYVEEVGATERTEVVGSAFTNSEQLAALAAKDPEGA